MPALHGRIWYQAAAAAVRLPRRATRVRVGSFGPAESGAASWNCELGPQDDIVRGRMFFNRLPGRLTRMRGGAERITGLSAPPRATPPGFRTGAWRRYVCASGRCPLHLLLRPAHRL